MSELSDGVQPCLTTGHVTVVCYFVALHVVVATAMADDDYYVAGVVISLSVVHGGPAPRFLATELYAALVGNPDSVDVTVTSLPECSWKPDLEAVSSHSMFSHAYLYILVHFWTTGVCNDSL